jgi:hypothetical protein
MCGECNKLNLLWPGRADSPIWGAILPTNLKPKFSVMMGSTGDSNHI